jgi:hypothetical protein
MSGLLRRGESWKQTEQLLDDSRSKKTRSSNLVPQLVLVNIKCVGYEPSGLYTCSRKTYYSLRTFLYIPTAERSGTRQTQIRFLRFQNDPKSHLQLQILDDKSRGAAATVADTSNTNLSLVLLEHIDQRRNNTSAGAAQRVTYRDRTTVDVDILRVKS